MAAVCNFLISKLKTCANRVTNCLSLLFLLFIATFYNQVTLFSEELLIFVMAANIFDCNKQFEINPSRQQF